MKVRRPRRTAQPTKSKPVAPTPVPEPIAESPAGQELRRLQEATRAYAESPAGQEMRRDHEAMRDSPLVRSMRAIAEEARQRRETSRDEELRRAHEAAGQGRDQEAMREAAGTPRRTKNPGGRPPRDLEPAKQWLREYIKVKGRDMGQEALNAIMRDQYFDDHPPAPHIKTIEVRVVRPVWREAKKTSETPTG
jgi:hypothetical protein